jgi:hypothetical protein
VVLTRRGKTTTLIVVAVIVAVVALGALVFMGKAPGPIQDAIAKTGLVPSPSPDPTCPLTGAPPPGGSVPDRTALAIKVENLPEARPQSGLDKADIIFEEPVEGGITRFIVIFHCEDADRVEPVRSARTTDPLVLKQLGTVAFGYADAAGYVQRAVEKYAKQIDDVNWQHVPDAYHNDPARAAPHDLYTSTRELYEAATKRFLAPPTPLFSYGEMSGKSKRVKDVRLYFSDYSDVHWKWVGAQGIWARSHGSVKHTLDTGDQVMATNVVIQTVEVANSDHLDPAGNPVPEVTLIGGGKAYLLRDGRMYSGKWSRNSKKALTSFTTAGGQEFVLAPGKTWVELFPKDRGKPQL